jgi:hypothetical protein
VGQHGADGLADVGADIEKGVHRDTGEAAPYLLDNSPKTLRINEFHAGLAFSLGGCF